MPDRVLHVVGIVHGERDMGCLSDELRQSLDDHAHETKQAVIASIWDAIDEWASAIDVSTRRTRLYQDGLPICEHERKIVRELAAQGLRNHALLERLIARGAELIGTEDPELLVRELELARRLASGEWNETHAQTASHLLDKRDLAIAERIKSTLRDGEQGILFIGLLHDVSRYMSDDITIRPVALRVHTTRQGGSDGER